MSTRSVAPLAAAAASLLWLGCLPGDTRPVPAALHFTAEPSAADIEGVTTHDGWRIVFERILVSLGGAGVNDDDDCTGYSNAGYDRLLDFTVPRRQKLGDAYALGACDLRFRMRATSPSSLLGEGVSAEDLALMQTLVPLQGSSDMDTLRSVYVRGHATRGDVIKHFDWSFSGTFRLEKCTTADGSGDLRRPILWSGESLPIKLVFHAEELFRERPRDGIRLRFDALAAADSDGDQVISLEELDKIPGPPAEPDVGYIAPDDGVPTLVNLLNALLERAPRLDGGGPCALDEPRR